MPASLEPIRRVKCTYKDCSASFDSEKAMRYHKRDEDEHDYCYPCDEDFDSHEELVQHKAFRPDKHNKACRVCGEEFKSKSGLLRHIEFNHKIDQKLSCIGCGEEFYRASLLTEHLEFGHCPSITAVQFQGHIVHKYLITELLRDGPNLSRLMQKISKYDAALDTDEEGGVDLLDDRNKETIDYKAIEPEIPPESLNLPKHEGPFPRLPSHARKASRDTDLSSTLRNMSLGGDSESVTATSTIDKKASSADRQIKAWGSGSGSAANRLFPGAKPTPPPSEFSIKHHDNQMEHGHGVNIMSTRFWDPLSNDWNPERFYDTVLMKYTCPFICEQTFDIPVDLSRHIIHDHRITRMKCPSCLKYFKSCTALMCHCESRGSKCQINKADDYSLFLDKLTGGFLAVEEKTRPDHLHNPSVMVENPETGMIEHYKPPVASYLQYSVTKPADWKDPSERVAYQIGGGSSSGGENQIARYQKQQSRW